MSKKIEVVVDDPEHQGMLLTYRGEPLIVISPVNHAGWRKLSCVLPHDTTKETYLKDVKEFVTNELGLHRNNKMEYWRWDEEIIQEETYSFPLYSINLRSNIGEEE
ncbi:MAG: hypothetical protein CML17_01175 [Pusillimonas sp.]|jgi:hypothetical protein|nr:hypothetical protein [Pusillimonas sp.]